MDRNELRERNKLIREQLGKFILDMAKLAFAGWREPLVGVLRVFMGSEILGGLFYDVANLVFAAVVLGGFTSITNESESADLTLVMSGVFATGLLFFIGYKILK